MATRFAANSKFTPTTSIGAAAKEISNAAIKTDAPHSSESSCWEVEPRILFSLERLSNFQSSRFGKAAVYISSNLDIIGYEKNNGVPVTLVTKRHPFFANFPPGTLVDNNWPNRCPKDIDHSNPLLDVIEVHDQAPQQAPLLLR